MNYTEERDHAIAAVRKACRLCRRVRNTLVSPDTLAKKDRSPVTVADFGAQALVCRDLAAHFPADPVVAEEDAGQLRAPESAGLRAKVVEHVRAIEPDANEPTVLAAIDHGGAGGGARGRFWALDPIDGTKGFLRGEQYAVALALIENGDVVLGVLGCPNLPFRPGGSTGALFVALRGAGAFSRALDEDAGEPVRVSPLTRPEKAVICESVEAGHSSHGDAARVAAALGLTRPPLRMDSQCKYAAVARGDADIYLRLPTRADYEEKIWDHAAGSLIVQEAGGRVSDILGHTLDFSRGRTLRDNKGVVATNGGIHAEVLAAVRASLAL